MVALLLTLALAGQTAPSTPCDLHVQVVDDATGKALPKIAVNLRLGLENDKQYSKKLIPKDPLALQSTPWRTL
jgi:hypothetical protein